MSITYGYELSSNDDPFVISIGHLAELMINALTSERATLLDTIPLLKYIPPWLPGGEFKKQAEECRAVARVVLGDPVKYAQVRMVAGTATTSFVNDSFEMETGKDLTVSKGKAVRAVAATVFLAGAETTSSTLLIFLLAMMLHPETQVGAQEEIDRVVGDTRLP